jgi:antitoxin (DNA-binding transcriptional repressor) of toxin-antitoxin stability system
VKKVDMADATAPLSKYASEAQKNTVVVTRRGKPLAAVVPLNSDDWEDFVVSQDPGFIEVIKRSEGRYRVEGGISLEEMRRKYGLAPKAVRRSRRKAR